MKRLTVIIVFLNEGAEVYNTVASIRENSSIDEVDIMLINDASDDGYDYKSIAKIFDTAYYSHSNRIGVAGSRNEGVNLSNTEYFILLDAHMRVYQKNWVSLLANSLERNKKSILCCQTIPLDKSGNIKRDNRLNYGAYIDFEDLSVKWNSIDYYSDKSECIIPCVLGASYASSKSYWRYLKGTNGLKSYGFEEQLISIKSWLAGGDCVLLKDITFGHIYRTVEEVPYELINVDFMYNRFYISTLFLDSKDFFLYEQTYEGKTQLRNLLLKKINKERRSIDSQILWYRKVFKRDISFILEMNAGYKVNNVRDPF